MARQKPPAQRYLNPIIDDWTHLIVGAYYDLYGSADDTTPRYRKARCGVIADDHSAFFWIDKVPEQVWKQNYTVRPVS